MQIIMKERDLLDEEILKAAFTEAARREIEELEKLDIKILFPTDAQRKEVKDLITKMYKVS